MTDTYCAGPSDAELKDIQADLAQASPAPWHHFSGSFQPHYPVANEIRDKDGKPIIELGGFDHNFQSKAVLKANAKLIANLRNMATTLVGGLLGARAELAVARRENARLAAALAAAVKVAGEARSELDAAPNNMKAGKLLVALASPKSKYRADITSIHAALAKSVLPN